MANTKTKRDRLNIQKTYKIYIGGKFPRTESARYYKLKSADGSLLGNICLSSRKDFRDAVGAARGAFEGWSGKSAFNRSQILYRLAEMLEGRGAQFREELVLQGASSHQAEAEVTAAIDRLVYYAGWADKYQQIFSSVNPVASSHFNFTVLEPTGVVAILAPENSSLLGFVSLIAASIAGGNTCVVLASESAPLCAVTFAEVLHSSDVPAGVVNILTGRKKELMGHFALHMDVNAIVYCDGDARAIAEIKSDTISNLKRPVIYKERDWSGASAESPYFISDVQETKTTWHPIGK
ncbi:MAG: aldehyde dehydrogenase family protein [Flavobacteriales bacterium]|nr:aldehyde dehydrogenase family protein [Flavobacteriales bacterium]